jgi:predicted nucleic acid-binding protein
MTLRVMFDSNAYDAILHHGDTEKIIARRLSVITTEVQFDEIRQIADRHRREAMLDVLHRLGGSTVATSAPWDTARDIALGLAARDHCDLLVTDDRQLAHILATQAPDLRVLTYENFRTEFLA